MTATNVPGAKTSVTTCWDGQVINDRCVEGGTAGGRRGPDTPGQLPIRKRIPHQQWMPSRVSPHAHPRHASVETLQVMRGCAALALR
jgi:hypothetical protein